MSEPLYFAHANSFPASVYKKMLNALAAHHPVHYLDTLGHDPAYPVTDCWPELVNEIIHHLEHLQLGPVHAVGHSLGGVLVLYAASLRPELFKSLVLLDSPLFSRRRALSILLLKRLGLINRVTPGGNTLHRRDVWASVDSVYNYFQRKTAFARFDPDCLQDYALHGTEGDSQGNRRLKFRPEIEYRIYNALPHNMTQYVGKVACPGLYLAAQSGSVLNARDLSYIQQHFGLRLAFQRGSHLFPLEYPLETAEQILQALNVLTQQTASATLIVDMKSSPI